MSSGFDHGGSTDVDENCEDSGGKVGNAGNCGDNCEDADNDGVVDDPSILAHTELAKTVREYPCPFYFIAY
jgi:hypothetical protein